MDDKSILTCFVLRCKTMSTSYSIMNEELVNVTRQLRLYQSGWPSSKSRIIKIREEFVNHRNCGLDCNRCAPSYWNVMHFKSTWAANLRVLLYQFLVFFCLPSFGSLVDEILLKCFLLFFVWSAMLLSDAFYEKIYFLFFLRTLVFALSVILIHLRG